MKKKILLLYFEFLSIFLLYAQKEDYNWVLSNGCDVNFHTSPPSILTNVAILHNSGVACLSDNNGNLLLYGDGINIFNKNNQLIFTNNNLCDAYRSIIVPIPNSQNQCYFFTSIVNNSNKYNLIRYTVDLSINNGVGAVISSVIMYEDYSVGKMMLAAKHPNNKDYWFIFIDGDYDYTETYLIDNNGISSIPVVCNLPDIEVNFINPPRITCAMDKIVYTAYTESICFLDFNNENGLVSNYQIIPYNNVGTFELSPDGTKLYVMWGLQVGINNYVKILQFDMTKLDDTSIFLNSIQTIYNDTLISYENGSDYTDMQLAPNGKIYVNSYLHNYLGIINNPNDTFPICSFNRDGLYLSGKLLGEQLPFFMRFYPAIININELCTNIVYFRYQGSLAQSVLWNFGDSHTSTQLNPTHNYANAGTYTVTLIVTYTNGQQQTINKQITINSKPINLIITHD